MPGPGAPRALNKTPCASIEHFIATRNPPEAVLAWLHEIWPTAYNAGLDAALYALDSHAASLKRQPRELSFDKRAMQTAEIGAVEEMRGLIPLYKLVPKVQGQPDDPGK